MGVASPLIKGLLQSLRGGHAVDLNPHYNVDLAAEALEDAVVSAAVFLRKQPRSDNLSPSDFELKVAESTLWWATRGQHEAISSEQWKSLLTGQTSHWPDGSPFVLCRRHAPDPLESLLRVYRPKDYEALERGQREGRWPSFESDEALISYLNVHPGAIALFAEGNLKYRGAPLRELKVIGVPEISVSLHFKWRPQSLVHSKTLSALYDLLKSDERQRAVEEWGWAQ